MLNIIKNITMMSERKYQKQEKEDKHPMSKIGFMQQEIILPIKNKLIVQRINVDKDSLYGKEIYFKKGVLNGTY